MSLSKKIAAALDENTKAYVLPCSVTVEESPESTDVAPHGPRHGRACLHRDRVRHDSAVLNGPRNALKEWGDRLAEPVTYLMEPLKVIEIDDGRRRGPDPEPESDPAPTNEGYYEIRLFREGSLADGTIRSRRGDPPASLNPLPAHARSPRATGRRYRRQRAMSLDRAREQAPRLSFGCARTCGRDSFRTAWTSPFPSIRFLSATHERCLNTNPSLTRPSSSNSCKPFGGPRRCSRPCHWGSSTLSNRSQSHWPDWPRR